MCNMYESWYLFYNKCVILYKYELLIISVIFTMLLSNIEVIVKIVFQEFKNT